jgi:hypothetical protein
MALDTAFNEESGAAKSVLPVICVTTLLHTSVTTGMDFPQRVTAIYHLLSGWTLLI